MWGDLVAATWGHFSNAVFLGLVPVAITAICTGVVISLAASVGRADDTGRLFTFAVFFRVVGGALGLMLGASREPAVKAFLPAIVTVLAGLFVYVFPREVNARRMALRAAAEEDDPAFVRSVVIVAIAAMMISATMGSFWGGSIRGLKENDEKRYAEWKAEYESVELPLRFETLKRDLGLRGPDAAAD